MDWTLDWKTAAVVGAVLLASWLTSDVKGHFKRYLAFRLFVCALMFIVGVIYYWDK